jgi:hypothetical protein
MAGAQPSLTACTPSRQETSARLDAESPIVALQSALKIVSEYANQHISMRSGNPLYSGVSGRLSAQTAAQISSFCVPELTVAKAAVAVQNGRSDTTAFHIRLRPVDGG